MVDCNQQRPSRGDSLVAYHADVSIEPVQGNSGDPSEDRVDHLKPRPAKLSGTPRNNSSASTIPIATVATPRDRRIQFPSMM